MLRIEWSGNRKKQSTFRPGEPIQGTVHWKLTAIPEKLTARLAWSTEGKGDEDYDVAIVQEWNPESSFGQVELDWIAPRAPLSLVGHLIRIQWHLKLSSKAPNEEKQFPIILSNEGTPIVLTPAAPTRLGTS